MKNTISSQTAEISLTYVHGWTCLLRMRSLSHLGHVTEQEQKRNFFSLPAIIVARLRLRLSSQRRGDPL